MSTQAARVGIRSAVVLLAALALAALHLPGRPRTLCLSRELLGVPCPLCGSTTAAVDLGRGELAAAVLASPLALLAAGAFVARPLLRLPRLSYAQVWVTIAVVVGTAELWQLFRFGIL